MPGSSLLLLAVCLFGHFALWTGLFSRLHGMAGPHAVLEIAEKLILAALLGVPAWLVIESVFVTPLSQETARRLLLSPPAAPYAWACFGVAAYVSGAWFWRTARGRPRQYLACQGMRIDARQDLHAPLCKGPAARTLARLPGNQILQLEINQKQLQAPRLPDELDGLSIAHISDLHFAGHIRREFFDWMVDHTNALQADLIALTGDIVDREACLPWIRETLGRLSAPSGVYCIFGNHDQRKVDLRALAREVRAAGLHYLGGRWRSVRVRDAEILLAGNERPWIAPAADPSQIPPPLGAGRRLRVLLAHSPDQIGWARAADFDLMLAGHTHGGQIRLPGIGPLIGQSLYGVRYCCGVFYESPTLLHVSRGVSGLEPIRIHCRPEITRILLRTARAAETTTGFSRSRSRRETCEKPVPACSVRESRY